MGMFFNISFLNSNNYAYYLILHPHHKLKYFEKAGWKAEWITAAKEIIHAEFGRSYVTLPDTPDEHETVPPVTKSKVCIFFTS